MQAEIWKRISGFEDYEVSDLGRVRHGSHIMAQCPDHLGYVRINLCKDGVQTSRLVHRLVAEAFISNPRGFPVINHKDENPQNNAVDNLEWCTQKYNMNYGTCQSRRSRKLSKRVQQLDKAGNILSEYASVKEAYQKTGICKCQISRCCCRTAKTAGGYVWRFK